MVSMNERTPLKPALFGIRGKQMTWLPEGDGESIRIFGICVVTEEMHSIVVKKKEIEAFDPRGKIGPQFPSLEDDRDALEFLISGCSPKGWEIAFGKEVDEEEVEE